MDKQDIFTKADGEAEQAASAIQQFYRKRQSNEAAKTPGLAARPSRSNSRRPSLRPVAEDLQDIQSFSSQQQLFNAIFDDSDGERKGTKGKAKLTKSSTTPVQRKISKPQAEHRHTAPHNSTIAASAIQEAKMLRNHSTLKHVDVNTDTAASAIQQAFRKKLAKATVMSGVGGQPDTDASASQKAFSMSRGPSKEQFSKKRSSEEEAIAVTSGHVDTAASAIQKAFRKKKLARGDVLSESFEDNPHDRLPSKGKVPKRWASKEAGSSKEGCLKGETATKGDGGKADTAANAIQNMFRKKKAMADASSVPGSFETAGASGGLSALSSARSSFSQSSFQSDTQKTFKKKARSASKRKKALTAPSRSGGNRQLQRSSTEGLLAPSQDGVSRRSSGSSQSQSESAGVSWKLGRGRSSRKCVKRRTLPARKPPERFSVADSTAEAAAKYFQDAQLERLKQEAEQIYSEDSMSQASESSHEDDDPGPQPDEPNFLCKVNDQVSSSFSFEVPDIPLPVHFNVGDNSAERTEARLSGSPTASATASRRTSLAGNEAAAKRHHMLYRPNTPSNAGVVPSKPLVPELAATADSPRNRSGKMTERRRLQYPTLPDEDIPVRYRRVPKVHVDNFSRRPAPVTQPPSGPLLAAIIASGQEVTQEVPGILELSSNQPCLRKALSRRILPPVKGKPNRRRRAAPSGLTCLVARSTSGAGEGLLARLAEHWKDYKALQATELRSLQADPKRSPSLAVSPHTSPSGCSRTALSGDRLYNDMKMGAKAVFSPTESSLGFLTARPGYDPIGSARLRLTSSPPSSARSVSDRGFRQCWMKQQHRY